MTSPNLTWAKITEGRSPRGVGDLHQVQRLLWRWIGVCRAGAYDAVKRGDADSATQWMHTGAELVNSYATVVASQANNGGHHGHEDLKW